MPKKPFDASSYDYYLPECDIAQEPVVPRDSSRLLVLDRSRPPGSPRGMDHLHFRDLETLLRPGDCLVLNRTRVRRARLRGIRLPGGGEAEILLLEGGGHRWKGMIRPARRVRVGTEIAILPPDLWGEIGDIEPGDRPGSLASRAPLLRVDSVEGDGVFGFSFDGPTDVMEVEDLGQLPLPPYVVRPPRDVSGYQTVYARETGSAAAPTAGLHFTPRLLERLERLGVRTPRVVLHVGPGTFRPLRADDVRDHDMHTEWLEVSREAVDEIERTRARGGRVIALGTTAVRSLETAAAGGKLAPYAGTTDLYIYPGYEFRVVEGLVTNFHLPSSTLLLLVSAMAGRDRIMAAYREARRRSYRFYSFGDAMYILPKREGGSSR